MIFHQFIFLYLGLAKVRIKKQSYVSFELFPISSFLFPLFPLYLSFYFFTFHFSLFSFHFLLFTFLPVLFTFTFLLFTYFLIPYPLPQLFITRFLPIHQNTNPVYFCGDPDHKKEGNIKQYQRNDDLPPGHTERYAHEHDDG